MYNDGDRDERWNLVYVPLQSISMALLLSGLKVMKLLLAMRSLHASGDRDSPRMHDEAFVIMPPLCGQEEGGG